MVRPASYIGGMYPLIAEPAHPELWGASQLAAAPCLGPTGLTLRDWSGFGRHGTLTNMTASSWGTASGRHALNFNSSLNRVQTTGTGIGMAPSNFTASIWLVPAASQASEFGGYFFSDQDAAAATSTVVMRIQGNTNVQTWCAGFGDGVSVSNVVSGGTLVHILFTQRSSTLRELWINGQMVGSSTASVTRSAANVLCIGSPGLFVSSDVTYRGAVLDASFFSRDVSRAEIKLLASRPGIAYELAPRRRARVAGGFKAYWAARKAQILGGGL